MSLKRQIVIFLGFLSVLLVGATRLDTVLWAGAAVTAEMLDRALALEAGGVDFIIAALQTAPVRLARASFRLASASLPLERLVEETGSATRLVA